jgi:hypothetical protein
VIPADTGWWWKVSYDFNLVILPAITDCHYILQPENHEMEGYIELTGKSIILHV